jgi:peptidoglycan/LPS O-acetylase OafA/YrhL
LCDPVEVPLAHKWCGRLAQPLHWTRMKHRLPALDGLRGVAIALVLLYHAYVRWPLVVPYGGRFSSLPVISHGKVGVQLFFLISGFVIFMSLDQSGNFGTFMKRRWLRLWPAMLAASILLFVTAPLFNRPQGTPVFRDLLPGLTFVEPAWWAYLLGSPQGVLEGAFWTLFVEMKFYVFAGAIYFLAGGRAALGSLIFVYMVPHALGRVHSISPYLFQAADFLSSWHWGWFAAGAIYYKAMTNRILMIPALLLSLFAASRMDHELIPMSLGIAVLFGSTLLSLRLQHLLSSPVLLFMGAISYPLYLVHENIMISLIETIGRSAPWMPAVLIPLLPISAVIFIGWMIMHYVEPPARRWLAELLKKPVAATNPAK